MSISFKQDDVFPLIFRLITDQTNRDSEFISHTKLVDLLLSDVAGALVVAAAEAKNKFDTRTTASNMVAWFSQTYTIGENAFSMLLERKQVNKTWAYRSKERCSTSLN